MTTLNLQLRENTGTAQSRRIRTDDVMPAVFYGRVEKSTPVTVSKKDFLAAWKEAGESTVITLKLSDGEKDALIHDVDLDPVSGEPRHVDFYVIEAGKKLEVSVPLEFEGIAPAVKELGGTLVKVLHELNIEAMPKDLPHSLTVDVSGLKDFDGRVLASDVVLPNGVALISDPEEVVALVEEHTEEVEEAPEAPDLDSIEVEQKGKEKSEESDAGDDKQGD